MFLCVYFCFGFSKSLNMTIPKQYIGFAMTQEVKPCLFVQCAERISCSNIMSMIKFIGIISGIISCLSNIKDA